MKMQGYYSYKCPECKYLKVESTKTSRCKELSILMKFDGRLFEKIGDTEANDFENAQMFCPRFKRSLGSLIDSFF